MAPAIQANIRNWQAGRLDTLWAEAKAAGARKKRVSRAAAEEEEQVEAPEAMEVDGGGSGTRRRRTPSALPPLPPMGRDPLGGEDDIEH